MRSLFKSPFNSPMRSPTAEEVYTFKMHLTPGTLPYDEVTNSKASCSISGARYGIVNGVVAQFAENVPPIEDKGLRGCPEFTQLAKYSEALTNAAWIKTNLLIPTIHEVFQGLNIWNLPENTTASVSHTISTTVFTDMADNSVCGMCFIAKYNGRKLYLDIKTKAGTYPGARINLQTGVFEVTGASTVAHSITSQGNGYYLVFLAFNVGSGASNPYIFAQLYSTTTQYTGDGVSGVYLGQPTYINFGVNGAPFIPPYIPNNTGSSVSCVSETATSTTGTSFDLDAALMTRLKTALRGPNAQGHLELEFVSNFDSGWLANNTNLNIFSVSNSNLPLYYRKNTDGTITDWNLYDGTNDSNIVQSLSVGQIFKIALDYGTYTDGTQKMRLTVNGVKSNVVDFSGAFGTQDLRFFYGNTVHVGWIKNLSYSEKPLW